MGDYEDEVVSTYDDLARGYHEATAPDPHYAHLEFPAMRDLLGDVSGRRVLDAGCGTGRYAEWLDRQGADVVGVDASPGMLEQAADRLGDDVELHEASLAEPLDCLEPASFDLVVSSLVLDYLEDWSTPISEFARVLAPGGALVVSVAHPFAPATREAMDDYFAVEQRPPDYEGGVRYYRRPLQAILEPVRAAGLAIDAVVEPEPTAAFREADPETYETVATEPTFLCLRAVNDPRG